ncbi:MAG: GDSL-type esterase/lipase family protein [Acidobacteriota bacterium]
MRAVLLLLPSVLVFGTAELALRHAQRDEWPWGIARDDPELGWVLNPGWSGRYHGTTVTISDAGLRDPRPAAALREMPGAWVFLGDSVVMGYGVGEDDSLPRALERVLGEPVVNAGVIGYGTAQEIALLGRIPVADPGILLGVCLNDIASQDQYQLRTVPVGRLGALAESMRRRSALFHWMRERAHALMRRAGKTDEGHARDYTVAELEARLEREPDSALRDLRDGVRRLARIGGAVVVFPYREQIAVDASSRAQDAIVAEVRIAGVPCLDLLPIFRKEGGTDLYHDNCHLSARGARVAANAIAATLVRPTASR